jgi:hypothetical protein
MEAIADGVKAVAGRKLTEGWLSAEQGNATHHTPQQVKHETYLFVFGSMTPLSPCNSCIGIATFSSGLVEPHNKKPHAPPPKRWSNQFDRELDAVASRSESQAFATMVFEHVRLGNSCSVSKIYLGRRLEIL